MAKVGSQTRAAAVAAMMAATEERRLLGDALPKVTRGMEPGEIARVGRLATGALRWAGRSDRLLGPYLRLKPDDHVLNLMRLALFEMFVENVPSHAAVDGAVSLAHRSKAGLVNAVLRNVLRGEPVWDEVPLPSLPKWLRKRLVEAWGKDTVAALEEAHTKDVPLDITLRDQTKAGEWAEILKANVLPTGSLRLNAPGQISALPGFDEGAWWVQDAGAAVVGRMLDAKPDESVLDLCAAPGGKAMQLASTGAQVTAVDSSKDRMVRLKENLFRTRLAAESVIADALAWTPTDQFDAILVDAPCSATGTLRRHPDLAYARDGSGINKLVELQAAMLDRALTWLKPGGRLVFATCSLLPEEGEVQLAALLKRHPKISASRPKADWADTSWYAEGGGLRLRPDHWAESGGIDGFFIARVEKPS